MHVVYANGEDVVAGGNGCYASYAGSDACVQNDIAVPGTRCRPYSNEVKLVLTCCGTTPKGYCIRFQYFMFCILMHVTCSASSL